MENTKGYEQQEVVKPESDNLSWVRDKLVDILKLNLTEGQFNCLSLRVGLDLSDRRKDFKEVADLLGRNTHGCFDSYHNMIYAIRKLAKKDPETYAQLRRLYQEI